MGISIFIDADTRQYDQGTISIERILRRNGVIDKIKGWVNQEAEDKRINQWLLEHNTKNVERSWVD